jgi:hypothetical protein
LLQFQKVLDTQEPYRFLVKVAVAVPTLAVQVVLVLMVLVLAVMLVVLHQVLQQTQALVEVGKQMAVLPTQVVLVVVEFAQ